MSKSIESVEPAPVEVPKPAKQVDPLDVGPRKPFEQWAREKRTPLIDVRRTALMHRWPIGREVTEARFDASIEAAATAPIR